MQKWHKEPRPKTPATRQNESDIYGGQPLYLRKERTTTNGIGRWSSGQQSHVGSGGTLNKILYAILRGKIEKQIVGTSSALRRIRK
jgi:hypothetical protein